MAAYWRRNIDESNASARVLALLLQSSLAVLSENTARFL